MSEEFANENEDVTVAEARPTKRKLSDFEMALAVETKGLNFISETDAPFKIITREGMPFGHAITIPFDDFFENLTQREDYFTPAEVKRADRFVGLKAMLEKSLYGLTVVKVSMNATERMIFVFGKDEKGKIVGLEIFAVES